MDKRKPNTLDVGAYLSGELDKLPFVVRERIERADDFLRKWDKLDPECRKQVSSTFGGYAYWVPFFEFDSSSAFTLLARHVCPTKYLELTNPI